MIDVKDYITLAIHTPAFAMHVKALLAEHGVDAKLEDFVSFKSQIIVAQRIKIPAKDLPVSLKVLESVDCYQIGNLQNKITGLSGKLLIPVDFSDLSMTSVSLGFKMAFRLNLKPILLNIQTTIGFGVDVLRDGDNSRNNKECQHASFNGLERMIALKNEIRKMQKQGALPPLKFKSDFRHGIPEESILEYCKEQRPEMIVMTTRDKKRKGEELVGSVTAEVLDSSRFPVFAIPEHCRVQSIEEIENLVFFCNLENNDIISLDYFLRIFGYPQCSITLIYLESKKPKGGSNQKRLDSFLAFCKGNYPQILFDSILLPLGHNDISLDEILNQKNIDAMVMPIKKVSLLSRLFRPNIAHKSLFNRDIPIFTIPV